MFSDADTVPTLQPTIYKLEPSRFAGRRRELLIRLGIVIPLVGGGIFYLMWRFDRDGSTFSFVLILVLMISFVYGQFRDQRSNWQNLAFESRDGKFIRRLDRYPTVELVPSEVTAIIESPRGTVVHTNDRFKKLFLSNSLSDYEGLRGRLLSWAPSAKVSNWRGTAPQSLFRQTRLQQKSHPACKI